MSKTKISLRDRLCKHNKLGFSLVELIVVVAIMAVLVAVLAPSLLSYVERTRAQKDTSTMDELTNAVLLAMSDMDVYDELLVHSIEDNVSCYIDDKDEATHSTKKTPTKEVNGTTVQYIFSDEARLADEVTYFAAGNMRGLTITFKPDVSTKAATYDLSKGVINKFIGDDGSNIESCLTLYNRVRATVGDKIELTSQTYRNSEYTIFIRMGSFGGADLSARDSVQVYGQFNGTNLPASSDFKIKVAGSRITDNGTTTAPNTPNIKVDMTNKGHAEILDGNNKTYEKGSISEIVFRSEADFDTFQCVLIDDAIIEPGDDTYNVTEGSTIVTFKAGYFENYEPGEYDVKIVSRDKCATGIVNVTEINPNPDNGTTPVNGETYVCGDYKYTYQSGGWSVELNTDKDKTAYGKILESINGKPIKKMLGTFKSCSNLVTSPVIPSSVTNMEETFYGCTSLTTAPDLSDCTKLTTIRRAFANCKSLVKAPDLSNCTKLSLVDSSFNYCTLLEVAPNFSNCTNIINIGYTFQGCSNLRTYIGSTDPDGDFSGYVIPNSVKYIESMFNKCDKLIIAPSMPNSITSMERVFAECTSLTTIPAIPNNITSMFYTFNGCTSLTDLSDLVMSNGLTEMRYTFYNCTALESAPNLSQCTKLTNMDSTFYRCTELTTAPPLPNSVTDMYQTFWGCSALKTVPTIPSDIVNLDGTFIHCVNLVTVPDLNSCTNLTNVRYAFSHCALLTDAPAMPNSVVNMEHTFQSCTSLITAPAISRSVTNMNYAFGGCSLLEKAPDLSNCTELTDVSRLFMSCTNLKTYIGAPEETANGDFSGYIIPSGVESMANAFSGCTSLTTAPNLSNCINLTNMQQTFNGCNSLKGKVYVPCTITISTWSNCPARAEQCHFDGCGH